MEKLTCRVGVASLFAGLVAAVVFSGCATVWYGRHAGRHSVELQSDPESSEVSLGGRLVGMTPLRLELDTREATTRQLRFEKSGYLPRDYRLVARPRWLTIAGNLVFTLGIGLFVDSVSGTWKRFPASVNVRLTSWSEHVQILIAKLSSDRDSVVLAALEGLGDLGRDAMCAVPWLVDNFPVVTVDLRMQETSGGGPPYGRGLFGGPVDYTVDRYYRDIDPESAPVGYRVRALGDCATPVEAGVLTENYVKSIAGTRASWEETVLTYFVTCEIAAGAYALQQITGRYFGTDWDAWRTWWTSQRR